MSSVHAQRQDSDRLEKALQVDVFSYLASKGINPIHDSGSYYYYKSPLHGGNRGSLIVNKNTNRWIDYRGKGSWDRILSLVMEIEGVSFPQAIDVLISESEVVEKFERPEVPTEPAIRWVEKKNDFNYKLQRYIKFRKLDMDLVKAYCKQLTVVFPRSRNPKRRVDFIAFKNELGGWELRNWKLKRCIAPKYYTLIGSTGDRYIFEGFVDYLSYLTYHKIESIDGRVIILHSISLLPWVFSIMREPGENFLYFDNDYAATEKISLLEEVGISFEDRRKTYLFYNDVNNMLRKIVQF